MIKVSTFCSGIGSPEQALTELGIEYESVFSCEKDKYAKQTYLANFKTNKMFDDMTAMDMSQNDIYSDINISGIPCQSFSLAGKREGINDARGLLFYNFYDYVKIQKPKYFIIENVKGLLSDAKGRTFQSWLELLGGSVNQQYNMINHDDCLSYNLHWAVLNSKNFGVPQNRERVFIVGIRQDLPNDFRFPVGFELKIRLKDILEPVVDEKYYLSEKNIEALMEHKKRNDEAGNGFGVVFNDTETVSNTIKVGGKGKDDLILEPFCVAMRGRDPNDSNNRKVGPNNTVQTLEPNSQGITNTITSVQKDNLIVEPKIIVLGNVGNGHEAQNVYDKQGLAPCVREMHGKVTKVVVEPPELKKVGSLYEDDNDAGRIYSDEGISTTLKSLGGGLGAKTGLYTTKNRIRRLTPLECFRLQGFPDEYVKPCSDSQTYKQAGNTITVNVIKAILRNLLTL